MMRNTVDTIYGRFNKSSKKRLNLAFDYEATEIIVFKRIAALLKSDTVVDIGANIGLYSIYSLGLDDVKTVYGVEASRQTYEEMKANFDLQDTDKMLIPLNYAVSDKRDVLTFREFGGMAGNNAVDSTSFMPKSSKFDTVEVEADLLDDLVEYRNGNFATKIDVEGHEIEVLKGATEFLSSSVGFLQVEIIGSGNLQVVRDRLEGLDYELVGWLKSDYYFVHRSFSEKYNEIREIIFDELQVALTRLKSLNRMRRRILSECKSIGRAAEPIRNVVRFKKDPLLNPNVYLIGKTGE